MKEDLNALGSANLSDVKTKIRINHEIMKLAKERIDDLGINKKLNGITIDGLPASLNTMVVAASVARDCLDFYKPDEDGELYDYMKWFIDTTLTMMKDEYLKKKKACIINSYLYFYDLFDYEVKSGKSLEEIAEKYGIVCNNHLIKKAAKISELV